MFRLLSYEDRSKDRAESNPLRGRGGRCSVLGTRYAVLLLLLALTTSAAYARVHHTEAWARERFAAAERMREALNGRPPAERTRRDYQRVINNYRSVYYGAPTSTKADPSVVAVAETLVEMGRRFDDDKILNEAIAQYKFLRKEYPGSKYRCDALFTIGEIYNDDLSDSAQARTTFQEFLHRYPHNRLAEDAEHAIAEIDRQAQAQAAEAQAAEAVAEKEKKIGKGREKNKSAKDSAEDAEADLSHDAPAAAPHSGRLPRVTGIRHWSTPDYTRVAIDLESEVKFASQRISSPDRIFFDLRDTKLASTLVGKSFDVDDGFLKKIRVAQFEPGRTRVVLEVDDLSDYEAFLLPNPYRLIVDIHGKDGHGKNGDSGHAKSDKNAEVGDVEAPPKAGAPASDAANPDIPKPDVPKAELKADMKALTGKPVSRKEQIHDEPSAPSRNESTSAKAGDLPGTAKTASAENSTAAAPVKKVVVDDGDDSPLKKVARADASTGHGRLPSRKAAKHDTGDPVAKDKPADLKAREDVREARPTASGDRSLIRALGLKIGRIVIDPGHGGHDTGTIGPNGLEEKDLVLEVGRRLGKLLETRLGAEVVYTRKNDTFIPLETRTAIANQQRADLFVSIHANSSRDPAARGVETYYLNFTSSPEALEVAARENAVSEKSIYELQDLVKKIALKEKIEESREFAGDVQESLHSGLASKNPGIRNRGVKKAPFIVLIGANMPSILAEISFVSNPGDERRLETSEYRQRIAESLYHGIAKYVDGLSGVKVASKMDRPAGQ